MEVWIGKFAGLSCSPSSLVQCLQIESLERKREGGRSSAENKRFVCIATCTQLPTEGYLLGSVVHTSFAWVLGCYCFSLFFCTRNKKIYIFKVQLNRLSTKQTREKMDVLPMCSIFQELQIVHDTGYFSALPSLEEYWQQVNISSYITPLKWAVCLSGNERLSHFLH